MEKELVCRVTRLRQRLSVEQPNEIKSPSTPTKKKAGKLTVKPNLDDIDENGSLRNPRYVTKETVENNEEDKPTTPLTRSSRTKSNTSITSESATDLNSPRAKRATRRSSITGKSPDKSKQLRRSRRLTQESMSEEPAVVEIELVKAFTENLNPEELKKNLHNSNEQISQSDFAQNNNIFTNNNTILNIRKSPRLTPKDDQIEAVITNIKTSNNSVDNIDGSISKSPNKRTSMALDDLTHKSHENSPDNSKSAGSYDTRKEPDNNEKLKWKNLSGNKTFPCSGASYLSKRTRTSSFTTILKPSTNINDFFSDNESHKKKHRDRQTHVSDSIASRHIGSGDGFEKRTDTSVTKKKKNDTSISLVDVNAKSPPTSIKTKSDASIELIDTLCQGDNITSTSDDQCVPVIETTRKNVENKITKFLSPKPIHTVSKTFDNENNPETNSVSLDKSCDTFAPEIFKCRISPLKSKLIFEPMDVDETIPENIHNEDCVNSSTSVEKQRNQSKAGEENCQNKNEPVEHLIMTTNMNIENNALYKSPVICEIQDKVMTPSLTDCNTENNRVSSDFLKFKKSANTTPVTDLFKQMQTSTPITTLDNAKGDKVKKFLSKTKHIVSSNSKEVEAADLSDHDSTDLFIDEAEEVDDDYKSGDSQSEEERENLIANEIVEKGETLTSDSEDNSTDLDYEKDSFIVSSAEEDDDLLSGSGDDLSDNTNELSFSAPSKEKYNRKKLKEQKRASREMFAARHDLQNESNKKKYRRLDSSNNDTIVSYNPKNNQITAESRSPAKDNPPPTFKQKNRRRLDSSPDNNSEILDKSLGNKSIMEDEITLTCDKNYSKLEDPLSVTLTGNQVHCENKGNKSLENKSIMEDEITLTCDENYSKLEDPLSVTLTGNQVQCKNKGNVSSIIKNIENFDVVRNTSLIITPDVNSNPLQDNLNDSDSSSDEEIVDNYNAVLKTLQESNSNEIKIRKNASLNHSNKSNKQVEPPIIAQLNLTKTNRCIPQNNETEGRGENLTNDSLNGNNTNNKVKNTEEITDVHSGDSSDCVDLKLLFTESDSDESKDVSKRGNQDEEDIIPLTSCEEEMNIFDKSEDHSDKLQFTTESGSTKKSKKKTSISESSSETAKSEVSISERDTKRKRKKSKENMVTMTEIAPTEESDVFIFGKPGSTSRKKTRTLSGTSAALEKIETNYYQTEPHSNIRKPLKRKYVENIVKASDNSGGIFMQTQTETTTFNEDKLRKKQKKEMKRQKMTEDTLQDKETKNLPLPQEKRKKRKFREDDEVTNGFKDLEENWNSKIRIPRLPRTVIEQLEDNSQYKISSRVTSTSTFTVEGVKKRNNKPSKYHEDSICLNNYNSVPAKRRKLFEIPKVLPSVPTASTSESGYTTNFRINYLSRENKTLTQATNIQNFKNVLLYTKRRRMGTDEWLKKQRTSKLSKF